MKNNIGFVKLALCCFLIGAVFLPVVNILALIGSGSLGKVFTNALLQKAVFNSFLLSGITAVLVVAVALLLAYLILHSNIRHKKFLLAC